MSRFCSKTMKLRCRGSGAAWSTWNWSWSRPTAYNRFAIRFAKNHLYQTTVSFRPHESVLKIDRKFSGSRRAIIHQRRAKVRHENGRLKLRVILDRFSVEVFVNDGEKVLSATLSTDLDAQEISFFADGAVRFSLTGYRLEA